MRTRVPSLFLGTAALVFLTALPNAQTPAQPAATPASVTFAKDIEPIFAKSCWNCHSKDAQLADLDLSTREAAIRGGEHGAAIVPGIVWCPSERRSPERTVQRGPARVSVPDNDAGRAFAALLGDAAEVVTVPDFRTEAWRKLMLNATAAPMVTEGRRAEVFREPEHLATAKGLAEEAAAVARAEGADIRAEHVEEVLATLTTMPPDLGTSMLFDRLAGRRLEWEARNGVVARLGRRHGIATPVTDTVHGVLTLEDRRARGAVTT